MQSSLLSLFHLSTQNLPNAFKSPSLTSTVSLLPFLFLSDTLYHFFNLFFLSTYQLWQGVLHFLISLAVLFCVHKVSKEEGQNSGRLYSFSRQFLMLNNFFHLFVDMWFCEALGVEFLTRLELTSLLARLALEQLWRLFMLDIVCAGTLVKAIYILMCVKLTSMFIPFPWLEFLIRARFLFMVFLIGIPFVINRPQSRKDELPTLTREDSNGSVLRSSGKVRPGSNRLTSMTTMTSLGKRSSSGEAIGAGYTSGKKTGKISYKRRDTPTIMEDSWDIDENIGATDIPKPKDLNNEFNQLPTIIDDALNDHEELGDTSECISNTQDLVTMKPDNNIPSESTSNPLQITNLRGTDPTNRISNGSISSLRNEELDWEHRIQARILNELPEGVVVIDYQGRIRFLNSYMRNTFDFNEKVSFAHLSSKLCEFKFVETSMHINDNNIKGISRCTGEEEDQIIKQYNEDSSSTSKDEFLTKVQKISSLEQLFESYVRESDMWEANQNCVPTFQTKFFHPLVTDWVPMEVKANLVSEAGDQKCLIILLRDTTGRDNKIFTLENEKIMYRNNLMASFSHELRTPLNANLAFLEQAIDSPEISATIKHLLIRPALASGKLLLFLINDILDYSQLIMHALKLKIRPYSLAQTVNTCLDLFQEKMAQKNINIKVHIDSEIPKFFYTDHARLNQILINLLSNAIKFTMDGSIFLSLKKTLTGSVMISVEDDGLGMEPDAQQKLKLRLSSERINTRINDDSVGIGLGLFISNKLAQMLSPKKKEENKEEKDQTEEEEELNKGIRFWSERNQGSHFYFEIENRVPFIKKEAGKVDKLVKRGFFDVEEDCNLNDTLNEYTTRPFKNMFKLQNGVEDEPTGTVLIVDDEVFNIIVIENFCKALKVPTEKAFNGKEAVQKLKENTKELRKYPVKIVFMDVNMPVMDGLQATMAIQNMLKKEEIEEVIIIGVTAYVSRDMMDKCYKSGMSEVLNKPLSKGMVIDVLKRHGLV